ncbi:MAG: DUF819 family protein [Bacteriovoracaceae bacterium]
MSISFVIQAIFIIATPAFCMWLANKQKIFDFLGPVTLCYAMGMIFTNLFGFSTDVGKTLSEISVPLSIPLLLLSTDFVKWLKGAKTTILSFVLEMFSVLVVAITTGYFYLKSFPETPKMAAMLTGVYVGGTSNMSAIKLGLGAPNELFLLLNASDMLNGSLYFFGMITIFKPILAKFTPAYVKQGTMDEEEMHYHWKAKFYKYIPLCLIYSSIILGISFLCAKMFNEVMFVCILIFFITTYSIFGSLIKSLKHKLHGSFDIGNYILLIFCLAIGSQAKPENLLTEGAFQVIIFTFIILFGSMVLHFLLGILFKIDTDTILITNTAGIFGPPFVGPIAKALKNDEIIVSGITTGLVGYALGNYLGYFVYWVLSKLMV